MTKNETNSKSIFVFLNDTKNVMLAIKILLTFHLLSRQKGSQFLKSMTSKVRQTSKLEILNAQIQNLNLHKTNTSSIFVYRIAILKKQEHFSQFFLFFLSYRAIYLVTSSAIKWECGMITEIQITRLKINKILNYNKLLINIINFFKKNLYVIS